MTELPEIGQKALRHKPARTDWQSFRVQPVRDLTDYQKVVSIRAAAFMSEQKCPYAEEFDGNDFSATHLLAYRDQEPIATLRIRWFSGFGKIERVCVIQPERGSPVVKIILAHAFEIAARKGYRQMIAQIQSRLWPLWARILHCELRTDRPEFTFSQYDYMEIDIPLPAHPLALDMYTDPYVMIRPEGNWDQPGPLEQGLTEICKPARAA